MHSTKRICLWSGPRNISTAIMYSFAQRNDTKVFDEPLYAHYLNKTKAKEYHPGAAEIMASMENDGKKVVEMMLGEHEKPVVFFKQMTHHLIGLDRSFLKDVYNVILTRHPAEVISSFAKVIENPNMDDLGYADHIQLIDNLREMDVRPIVLDSKQVLLNPRNVLKKLCEALEIPFEENMLCWEAKARSEDGVWAKYWYKNVHQSERFMEYKPKNDPFPEHLNSLLKKCLPYYQQLMDLSID